MDSAQRGMVVIQDTINNLFCMSTDNSDSTVAFYQNLDDINVLQDAITTREEATQDYTDTLGTKRSRTVGGTFAMGDLIVSYFNKKQQLGYRWPIPSPDEFGMCNDMNAARWLINQDLPSCGRLNNDCGGALDPLTYTSNLLLSPSPLPSPFTESLTAIEVNVHSVSEVTTTGVVSPLLSPALGSTGASCQCTGILLEAHYSVITDTSQKSILNAYADLIIGTTKTCQTVSQRFTLNFYSSPLPIARSGNPGYLVGKPLLFNLDGNSTAFATMKLGGANTDGSCANVISNNTSGSTFYLRSSPTVSFRIETIYSCFVELDFAGLKDLCKPLLFNSQMPIFDFAKIDRYLLAKFGNANLTNPEDFINIVRQSSLENQIFADSTGTCLLPTTLVLEFTTIEVGSVSNPQSKIVYAKAFFKKNT